MRASATLYEYSIAMAQVDSIMRYYRMLCSSVFLLSCLAVLIGGWHGMLVRAGHGPRVLAVAGRAARVSQAHHILMHSLCSRACPVLAVLHQLLRAVFDGAEAGQVHH